ncbi:hypothetical protein ACH5RR_019400 [Cinchona calisaya]|uniref:Uncharacterized protein n=1 Tax=Cinchona calisaya TaxID=153742 RepID=A0ABD2ZPB5_9GENT
MRRSITAQGLVWAFGEDREKFQATKDCRSRKGICSSTKTNSAGLSPPGVEIETSPTNLHLSWNDQVSELRFGSLYPLHPEYTPFDPLPLPPSSLSHSVICSCVILLAC